MNKLEISAVVLMFALLLGWGFFQRTLTPPPPPRPPLAEESVAPTNTAPANTPELLAAPSAGTGAAPVAAPLAVEPALEGELAERGEEQTVLLSNELAEVRISSWGGAVAAVEMRKYRRDVDRESPPVVLDFSARPALSLEDLPGLGTNRSFELTVDEGAARATAVASAGGVRLERTFALRADYVLEVSDVFSNAQAEAVALPVSRVALGPMEILPGQVLSRDHVYLGLDSLAAHGGERVRYWMTGGAFKQAAGGSRFGCAGGARSGGPSNVAVRAAVPLAWAAAKNKFFVQILSPEHGASDGEFVASRGSEPVISRVSAALELAGVSLAPGSVTERKYTYYVGPKDYTLVRKLGNHQDDIMEFGNWFGWICKLLLPMLIWIYGVIPNYGVAVIVLTIIVRIVFWPVTHKSTESMKKMQQLQPLVNELRTKLKDKPQKMNQEVMALYKQHKVNPMSGCLPTLIQIPVFIALYTVLRSAVELRFAEFLWIRDLSEPENLLAGVLKFGALQLPPLNILPLFMTATMVWQQKLTPSSADPQQQKMMTFMPVVMLFIFYNMASALVLYWSVSQCISIVQLLLQRRKAAAEGGGGGGVLAPKPLAAGAAVRKGGGGAEEAATRA